MRGTTFPIRAAIEGHHTMRRMISIVVLFVAFAIERPVTQTRESPLPSNKLARSPKWTKYVPPVVTVEDLGGQPSGLVMLELLIDPAGKVAEAKVRKSPPAIAAAALAAAKQWEYEPPMVDGKGVWVRIVSSMQIRPMAGAPPGASAPASQGRQDAAATPASGGAATSSNANAGESASAAGKRATVAGPAQVDIVHVSTGVARDGGHPATLVTREGEGNLREAFLIVHPAGSQQAISFTGRARVLGGHDSQLAVLPSTGRGWVFLLPKATSVVKGVTTRPSEVRIASIAKVPVGAARSHQQLEATLMRAR